MEDENERNSKKLSQSGKKMRMMSNPEEDVQDQNLMMCESHKRKVEFICQSEICFENRYLCTKCCPSHIQHSKFILTIDSYLNTMMEREEEICRQRKQMVTERVTQMKRIVKKIQKSIDRYESDELDDIQRQFNEVTIRCQEDKHKFLKDFCDPAYDTTTLFQVPLFNRECNYYKIQDTAQNMLNLIEKKEYNLQNLIGFLIRQDNLFEIAEQDQGLRINDEQQNGEQNRFNNLQNQLINEIGQAIGLQQVQNQENQQNIHQNNINPIVGQQPNNEDEFSEEEEENDDDEDGDNQFIIYDDEDDEEGEVVDNLHVFEEDEDDDNNSDWISASSISSDLENGRRITSFLRLSQNVLVFSNIKSVFYYNFVTRKYLNVVQFIGNTMVNKIVKLNEKKIAILLHRECIDEMLAPGLITFQVYFEVYIIEQTKKELKKKRVFAEKRGYEIRDIFPVQNSPLIAIVQEEVGIVIINTMNGKILSSYQSNLDDASPFEGIYSCTLLKNIKYDNILYKHLIAINLIDGTYGLWDFVSNSFVMRKRFSNNIGLNYKNSTSVRINEAFNTHIDKKNIYNSSNQNSKNTIGKFNKNDDQQYLIVIQGHRNESYLQRDYDGHLEVKMQHRLLDYFDLFYNSSAIPFYYNNSVFFYDFIQQKRLKTISLNTKFNQSAHMNQNHNQVLQRLSSHNQQQPNPQNNQNNGHQIPFNNHNQQSNVENINQRTSMNNNSILQSFIINSTSSHQSENLNAELNHLSRENSQTFNKSKSKQTDSKKVSASNQMTGEEENEEPIFQLSLQDVKSKRTSQPSSQKSSKSKRVDIKASNSQQHVNEQQQQQDPLSFSQMWDQSLLQFQQNQRNIQPIQFFSNIQQRQNTISPFNSTQINQQRRPIDALTHIEFGNPLNNRNFPNEISSLPEQNDLLQLNNHKLFDICPVGIINHYQFIVMVFPNGVIQYIK